jgi:hypothetical protein
MSIADRLIYKISEKLRSNLEGKIDPTANIDEEALSDAVSNAVSRSILDVVPNTLSNKEWIDELSNRLEYSKSINDKLSSINKEFELAKVAVKDMQVGDHWPIGKWVRENSIYGPIKRISANYYDGTIRIIIWDNDNRDMDLILDFTTDEYKKWLKINFPDDLK